MLQSLGQSRQTHQRHGHHRLGQSFGRPTRGAGGIAYHFSTDGAVIYGNLGNDTLLGGGDTDFIFGGQGDDSIRGNGKGDVLSGGLGNDTFVVAVQIDGGSGTESGVVLGSVDLVGDFATGQDKIRGLLGGNDVPGTASNYNEYEDRTVSNPRHASQSYAEHLLLNTYTFIAGDEDGYLVIDVDKNGIADGVVELIDRDLLSDFAFSDII